MNHKQWKPLTWIGWREHLSCFVVSSFVLISINSEGAQTIFPIGLTISDTNLSVFFIRNELKGPNESCLSNISPAIIYHQSDYNQKKPRFSPVREEDQWQRLVEGYPLPWGVIAAKSASKWRLDQRLAVWLLYLCEHVQVLVKTSEKKKIMKCCLKFFARCQAHFLYEEGQYWGMFNFVKCFTGLRANFFVHLLHNNLKCIVFYHD